MACSFHWRVPIVPARRACDNRRATRGDDNAANADRIPRCERASPRFDDIKRTRQVDDVNNFWKYLAHDPALLARTWASVKEVMAPGALDPLTKEMVYLAVSVTNGCGYCIASHTAAARKAGMSEAMFGELMGVVGMANETNRLANGYRVAVDPAFE